MSMVSATSALVLKAPARISLSTSAKTSDAPILEEEFFLSLSPSVLSSVLSSAGGAGGSSAGTSEFEPDSDPLPLALVKPADKPPVICKSLTAESMEMLSKLLTAESLVTA